MKKVITIIEDDIGIIESLTYLFDKDGFIVKSFKSAEEFFMSENRPTDSLYLIDWNLPGIKGIDIIRAIRQKDTISPIFMVTAYDDQKQVIEALTSGADDYITKPFDYDSLLIKVKNSHEKISSLKSQIAMSGLQIVPDAKTVIYNGVALSLTNTEFSLFHYLYKKSGSASSREELLSELESESTQSNRNIDVYISGLRKKIQKIKMSIQTVRGIGYKLIMDID